MSASDWRMITMCNSCPFASKGKGLALRKGLRRWRSILATLRRGQVFFCHKTTDDEQDDDFYIPRKEDLVCAGAIAWQEKHRCTSNYQRVCENLDYFAEPRAKDVLP
jgi:phenylpropionate dioxygenase-like ring-hydroxylating dioxygenase large terminal subunit